MDLNIALALYLATKADPKFLTELDLDFYQSKFYKENKDKLLLTIDGKNNSKL